MKLDSNLSQRLSFSKKGIEVYGISIFGQYIPMQGNGGSTQTPSNYFFLDSSYISILLQYGLIIFIVILIIWGMIGLRARKEKDWVLLWILAMIAFQSLMEQHLMDISYNPFLWIFLQKPEKAYTKKRMEQREDMRKIWKKWPFLLNIAGILILGVLILGLRDRQKKRRAEVLNETQSFRKKVKSILFLMRRMQRYMC